MSASLVGSEMCIRDRPPPTPGNTPQQVPPARAVDAFLFSGEGRGGGAVSYTHLTLPTICSV
eukprot:3206895-Alexandrium_andersonii.AAC.1